MANKFLLVSLVFIGAIGTSFSQIEVPNTGITIVNVCTPGVNCRNTTTTQRNRTCLQNDEICQYALQEGKPVCTQNDKCYSIRLLPNTLPDAPPNSSFPSYEIPCRCPFETVCDYQTTKRCVRIPGVVISDPATDEVATMMTSISSVNKIENDTTQIPEESTCPSGMINPTRMKQCRPKEETICTLDEMCMVVHQSISLNNIHSIVCECTCPEGTDCMYENHVNSTDIKSLYYFCMPNNKTSFSETNVHFPSRLFPELQVTLTGNETCAYGTPCSPLSCKNQSESVGGLYYHCLTVFFDTSRGDEVNCPFKCPDESTCKYEKDEREGLSVMAVYMCRPNEKDTFTDYCINERITTEIVAYHNEEHKRIFTTSKIFPPMYDLPPEVRVAFGLNPMPKVRRVCPSEDVYCYAKQLKALPICTPAMPCLYNKSPYHRVYICICPKGTRCPRTPTNHTGIFPIEQFCKTKTPANREITAMGTQELPKMKHRRKIYNCSHDEQCMNFKIAIGDKFNTFQERCRCPIGNTCEPEVIRRTNTITVLVFFCKPSIDTVKKATTPTTLTADRTTYEASTMMVTSERELYEVSTDMVTSDKATYEAFTDMVTSERATYETSIDTETERATYKATTEMETPETATFEASTVTRALELSTNEDPSWTTTSPEITTPIISEGPPECSPNSVCLLVLYEVVEHSRYTYGVIIYPKLECKDCTEGYSCQCTKDNLSQKYYEYSCKPFNETRLEKTRCYGI